MRFRSRLFLAFAAAALIPLALLAYGVRREMSSRLDSEAERRASAVADAVRGELDRTGREIEQRLDALAAELADDNDFRLAVVGDDPDARRRLLDWSGSAMRAGGLDLLRVYDSAGRILSSGHFRNEYDRVAPLLPRELAGADLAVARVRGPAGGLLAFVSSKPFTVAGRRFALAGGVRLDSARLAALSNDGAVQVHVLLPGAPGPGPGVTTISAVTLPFLEESAGRAAEAPGPAADASSTAIRFVTTRARSALAELQQRLDLWFAAALGATLLVSIALAAWLAARIARPITELADKTRLVDLDRLDQRFGSDRDDEVGALASLLDAMTVRLRRSTASLREAERRAATGDLARQVNHDIKNGLAPIRHVLRHLTQVAEREPASLAAVYGERRGTLEASVEYLEGLAREYARLSPALDRSLSRPEAVLREAAAAVQSPAVRVELQIAEDTPAVRADPVVLRRIVDNLVTNAVDAMEAAADGRAGTGGTLTLSAGASGADDAAAARIVVADTGPGMSREELDRSFQDFYTTKPGGSGLGLSVVRRLVGDLGGTLRVETSPGSGTRFIIELPAEREWPRS